MNAEEAKNSRYNKDPHALMEKHFPNGGIYKPSPDWLAQCKAYCDERDQVEEQRIVRIREQRIASAREAQRLQLDPEDLEGFRSLLKVLNFKNLT